MRIVDSLSRLSKTTLLMLGFAMLMAIGLLDYLTGAELSFSVFYLLPIALVAWLVGRKSGLVLSFVGAGVWLVAEQWGGNVYSYPAVPYWNALVRLSFFIIVTLILSALQESRARQAELGQFIVHDLRSPLANVITGLQTLEEVADEGMDATAKHIVQMCLISGNRMLTLISSLLDLAQLENRRMPLELSAVNVQALVEQSLLQVSMWANTRSVTVVFTAGNGAQTIYADATLIMRVLVNLLSNAIKFSPPQSMVTVQTSSYSANQLAFSISDQGPGIPAEWAGKIFDKYVQVEARKTKGGVSGSGLGLTFCRQAVEAQGGRIWLENNVDRGTKITFTVPINA
jgi:signal transduction histidine kinase